MTASEFRRILTAFADQPADVDLVKGKLLVQIRDELIEADVQLRDGTLYVTENGDRQTAFVWLVERVARVSLLADRILSYVIEPENFVASEAQFDEQMHEADAPQAVHGEAARALQSVLDERPAGVSSVVYLTSDAGEGKTTLIQHVARRQAAAYKKKETDWLLVPVPLGGRPFLRFDDVVVGALVNRLRFQFFYYDAFLELIKLGVIVPAFDGFEEMFIESSSGEALSALGGLLSSLDSSGSVLIAARKAYFEYRSFATQARLFDAVSNESVSFTRLALQRWSRREFLNYASRRNVAHADQLYQAVQARFNDTSHPILSRAVLVKRLLDVASQDGDLQHLLGSFGEAPQDYFYTFVNAIVEREAREKWIDRSGDPAVALLTVGEHHELLSFLAEEMWLNNSEVLKADMVDMVADLYSESRSKRPIVSRQIKERLKQHSLIASIDGGRILFSFDHEDFRLFFLGQALGRILMDGNNAQLLSMLRVAALPPSACDAAVQTVHRLDADVKSCLKRLQAASRADIPTSFTRENCGALTVRLLDGDEAASELVEGMTFPTDSLRGRQLRNIRFDDCYFYATSLEHGVLEQIVFENCRFEEIELCRPLQRIDAILSHCEVRAVTEPDHDARLFDPSAIRDVLRNAGFALDVPTEPSDSLTAHEPDEASRLAERLFRFFLRSTQINENVLRAKLGTKANLVFDTVIPGLLNAGVLADIPYTGAGRQRRFRLALPMTAIETAIRNSSGRFDLFLKKVNSNP